MAQRGVSRAVRSKRCSAASAAVGTAPGIVAGVVGGHHQPFATRSHPGGGETPAGVFQHARFRFPGQPLPAGDVAGGADDAVFGVEEAGLPALVLVDLVQEILAALREGFCGPVDGNVAIHGELDSIGHPAGGQI